MITDLRVGDYIENSELDKQKYNDIVEVFEQCGFDCSKDNGYQHGFDFAFCCDVYGIDMCKKKSFKKRCTGRKLTYSDIMSLKKVDVDNCNIDKVVSDECFRGDSTAKGMLKAAKAVLAMESLGHEWDEEKGQWFRKEYF